MSGNLETGPEMLLNMLIIAQALLVVTMFFHLLTLRRLILQMVAISQETAAAALALKHRMSQADTFFRNEAAPVAASKPATESALR